VTPDEKFLIMINDTNTRITNLDTGKTVADFAQTGDGARTTASPKGGYDLLISTPRPQYTGYDIYHYTLSKKGVPVGEPVKLYGETTPFDPDVFYSRRYTANQRNEAFIYDLDKPDSKLTLDGHTDDIMSASWSPDGEYVATAAWDGKGKLWSAHNGSFIADFENSTAQNWVTRFSPDGEYIAIANGARTLKIYTVADLNAPPIVINGFSDWIRNLQWSPDGEYIAAGSWGQVLVYSLSETKVVQKWELDTEGKGSFEVVDVTWLEGGSRIAYRYQATLEVYDFESNLKYAWGPGANDTYLLGFNVGGTFLLENRGWIGGFDWDHRVRFWEYPETERVTT
jgi:WD40 repeat protein